MMLVFALLFLASCVSSNTSNAIEELGEEVIKKKEGIDIRIIPIEEEKNKR